MSCTARALRYRRLALASADHTNANLLLKLADECDRGMLCTAEWRRGRPSLENEQPPKAVEARMPIDWQDPFRGWR